MVLRKSTEQFVAELAEVNPTVEIIGEYNGSREKTDCRCRICGHLWQAMPTNLLKGRKCPRCAKSGASYMDQFVYLAFVDAL